MTKIILASKSERRIDLLKQIGIDFKVMPADINESFDEKLSPHNAVKYISEKKGLYIAKEIKEDSIIISADTLVSVDNNILGKPSDSKKAFEMLQMLRGKKHSVYTGVSLIRESKIINSFVEKTDVFMRDYSDKEIEWYIETGEPFDKAGGYGIQSKGCVLVEKIEGDYFNVVGLPISKLYLALKNL